MVPCAVVLRVVELLLGPPTVIIVTKFSPNTLELLVQLCPPSLALIAKLRPQNTTTRHLCTRRYYQIVNQFVFIILIVPLLLDSTKEGRALRFAVLKDTS